MRFRHPAPVMALLRRTQKRNRSLSQQIQDAARCIENLRLELRVQERRAQRWRRTALELAPRVGPRAMDVCLLQVQSEEIEDLPQTEAGVDG